MPSIKYRLLRAFAHQHWIPRGRDKVLRMFSPPERQPSERFKVPFFGVPYTGDLSNYLDWTVYFYGCFSPQEIELLHLLAADISRKGPVNFYDVGANIGHHTLAMAPRVTNTIAFEPFPIVRQEMAHKLRFAGIHGVKIFPVALGDARGQFPFFIPVGQNLGTGSIARRPDNSDGEEIIVEVWPGDDFIATHDLPPISILKIDVETHEAAVLAGLRATLLRDRPPILLEVSGKSRSGFRSEQHLRDLVYPDAVIHEVERRWDRFSLAPFDLEKAQEVLIRPAELTSVDPRLNNTRG
jgi:FkbM family methyltransferase